MLKREDHMSAGEQTYIIIAIGAFVLFAVTMFVLDVTTNKHPVK